MSSSGSGIGALIPRIWTNLARQKLAPSDSPLKKILSQLSSGFYLNEIAAKSQNQQPLVRAVRVTEGKDYAVWRHVDTVGDGKELWTGTFGLSGAVTLGELWTEAVR
jgi:hypothetical protein